MGDNKHTGAMAVPESAVDTGAWVWAGTAALETMAAMVASDEATVPTAESMAEAVPKKIANRMQLRCI